VFSVRAGPALPQASGDLFSFLTSELTLEKKDFNAVAFAGDLSVRVAPRIDLQVGVGYASSEKRSEFQDWEGTDDLPVEQTTRLRRTPITGGLRYLLKERGRSVGEYAFVPSNIQPYVGVGAGVMFYQLEQNGEFVDFETFDIFAAELTSEGWGPLLQVFGGTDLWLGRFGVTLDARYMWSNADLENDFEDFGKIKLNGLQLTAGLAVRL
jgi:hypothetical protein